MGCRTNALARGGAAAAALAAAVVLAPVSPSSAAAPNRDDHVQQEIRVAFRALIALPPVARGRTNLQGYDAAMRAALRGAGAELLEGEDGRPVKVSETTGTATVVHRGEATVPLTITVRGKSPPPSYSLHYVAVALESHGRWQVSWSTMCLLVESGRQLCPPTPRHVSAGDVLPSAATSTGLTSGLVDPGPLAIAPDGGVLIADRGRNQILEWKSGSITVVAGDGLSGFTGDGGPALDAELNDPEEVAVGGNGTIYFVDSGNDRVRAITPNDTIETVAGDGSFGGGADVGDGGPATAAPLNPSGLAVGTLGDLFIGSNSDIREVTPGGVISTFLRGGPPAGDDVEVGGSPIAFEPSSMAFDGQGDLIVFSFSPKVLLSISPSGQVTQLAQDYATALAPAPDGSVLVGQHGAGVERVNDGTVATVPISPHVTGLQNGLVADGVAGSAGGTIYADSEYGDGFSDATGLYEVTDGVARPVDVTSSLASTLPAVGAPGFPPATYPATTASSGVEAALGSCPSMTGVVPFTADSESSARQLLGLWNISFSYDLHASDRSWWPGVVGAFSGMGPEGRQTVGTLSPAVDSLYAPAIAASCGSRLVRDSIEVVMGPSAYDLSYQHVFVLDRSGMPLVYFATI